MIVVKLKGGLGNQMFQFATGRSVALFHNTELKIDKGWFKRNRKNDTYRNYSLNIFSYNHKFAKKNEILKLKTKDIIRRVGSKLLSMENKRYYIKEKKDVFEKKIFKLKDAYLDGYWQSYKYFDRIKDTLKRNFKIEINLDKKNSKILKEIKKSQSIAIHVRRGDYIKNEKFKKVFHASKPEYYYKSIKYIGKKIKNPKYFVFSNDITWCKENLKGNRDIFFVEDNESTEDLFLMKNCKNHIIANSSFGWWPAYLNSNKNKVVIAPKKW